MRIYIVFFLLALIALSCKSKKTATQTSEKANKSIDKPKQNMQEGQVFEEEVLEISDPEITKVIFEIVSFKSAENAVQIVGKSCNKCVAEVILLKISSYGQEYDHNISEGETAILYFDIEENVDQLTPLEVGDKILTKLKKQRNIYICYAYEKIK